MAVMTWDSASQAFVDAEIPKTYNQQLEAWEDTNGYEYNHGLGAWEKVWPKELVIYDHGAELVDMDFINDKYYANVNDGTERYAGFSTRDVIDLTGYSKLRITSSFPGAEQPARGGFGVSLPSLPKIIDAVYPQMDTIYQSGQVCFFRTPSWQQEVDLSDITGSYYIYLICGTSSGVDSYAHMNMTKNNDNLFFSGYVGRQQFTVNKIWLE